MTDTDHELAGKITRLLDQGITDLEPRVAARLVAARQEALARHREERAPAWGWAAAANTGRHYGSDESRRHNVRLILLVAVLLSALAIGLTWQNTNTGSDIADIDASLLSDELPINAYLDKGFDSWVKRGSH